MHNGSIPATWILVHIWKGRAVDPMDELTDELKQLPKRNTLERLAEIMATADRAERTWDVKGAEMALDAAYDLLGERNPADGAAWIEGEHPLHAAAFELEMAAERQEAIRALAEDPRTQVAWIRGEGASDEGWQAGIGTGSRALEDPDTWPDRDAAIRTALEVWENKLEEGRAEIAADYGAAPARSLFPEAPRMLEFKRDAAL